MRQNLDGTSTRTIVGEAVAHFNTARAERRHSSVGSQKSWYSGTVDQQWINSGELRKNMFLDKPIINFLFETIVEPVLTLP